MGDNASTSVLAFHDKRWNSWRWRPILEKWGHLSVLINPDLLKTTAFLVANRGPIGTVFFVDMPLREVSLDGHFFYAVTTLHTVADEDVSIRFNLKGGGVKDVPVSRHDWIPHGATDLAILPISHLPTWDYDIEFVFSVLMVETTDYLISTEVSPNQIQHQHAYGVGDEVFSIGLFAGFGGEKVAQPAARFGHIALVPEKGEKISAKIPPLHRKKLIPIDAFLVEIAAWQGQSGSPVFMRPWVDEKRSKDRPISELNFLVGMIQGVYGIKQDVRINNREATIEPANMGLGIVIPSKDIKDLLMEDTVVKARKKMYEERRKTPEAKPMPLSVPSKRQRKREGEITRTGFEDALKRASRKAPESKNSDKAE